MTLRLMFGGKLIGNEKKKESFPCLQNSKLLPDDGKETLILQIRISLLPSKIEEYITKSS